VRRRAPPVERAGGRQDEGAAADGRHASVTRDRAANGAQDRFRDRAVEVVDAGTMTVSARSSEESRQGTPSVTCSDLTRGAMPQTRTS
jgi:hypothetical protein